MESYEDPFDGYDGRNVYPEDLNELGEDIYRKVTPAEKEEEPIHVPLTRPHPDFKPYGTKRTYPQNWEVYNYVKQREGTLVKSILDELLFYAQLQEPKKRGRKGMSLRDKVFYVVLQAYYTKSTRQCVDQLRSCQKEHLIENVPHFNTISNCLKDPMLTVWLRYLINMSGYPLKDCEKDFAFDSSGFSTVRYERWFSKRLGEEKDRKKFVKLHIGVGTRTNIITGVEVTSGYSGDSPQFPSLLKQTVNVYSPETVSADGAYSSRPNLSLVDSYGAVPYIRFSKVAKGRPKGSWVWRRLFEKYHYDINAFKLKYHRRSNVESTFQMLKSKFNANLKSKKPVAQTNEVLAKCLAHNLCVLAQESEELRISLDFSNIVQKEPLHKNR